MVSANKDWIELLLFKKWSQNISAAILLGNPQWNNNDLNQVFWACKNEQLQQTFVLRKTAGQQSSIVTDLKKKKDWIELPVFLLGSVLEAYTFLW